ncbi:response regulator [Aestuariirhabdus litorea]|uniref:Response regulator n=1 Tax=Aestuariirhabdus litorea TaxID=2528527 RepID=A0A3P3VRM5_9GAMM|nr:response regulator [Aestuariirhabdus litorea]RRJ85280.1 response regulator [Aestuariirhabdus litorea]RWW98501.1 response regulator [Endozoicomonadaceae bacterium GTF-13]
MVTRRARILFVDDEPKILHALKWLFRKGYDVAVAEGGQEALEQVKTFKPDVVVSDQRMPGMTGTQLLNQIKVISPGTMRLLLTGYSDYKAVVNSVNEGEIYRFVHKPWVNSQIRSVVEEAANTALNSPEIVPEQAVADGPSLGAQSAVVESGNILVIDDDESACNQLQEVLGTTHNLLFARSMDDAMSLLESNPVGVVISEVSIGSGDVTTLIKLLKRHYPEIVSVVMTSQEDANIIIELINQGQIYRFMSKPIKAAQCRINVESALRKHRLLHTNPALQRRHKVVEVRTSPDPEAAPAEQAADQEVLPKVSPGMFDSMLKRVRRLGSLWR